MRLLMGLSKNRHGTYYAIKKVPEHLQEAVARALNNGKASQTWLKRSLGTKDAEQANRVAKPVLIEFDRTLDRARALIAARPLRASLSPIEIKRMAEYQYAKKLAAHDEFVRDAPKIEAEFRKLEPDAGPWVHPIPEFGLSGGQLFDLADNLPRIVREAEAALSKGDIAHVGIQLEHLLETFQTNLDKKTTSYRELGLEVLRAEVRALRAIQQRDAGEPIETPPLPPSERCLCRALRRFRFARRRRRNSSQCWERPWLSMRPMPTVRTSCLRKHHPKPHRSRQK